MKKVFLIFIMFYSCISLTAQQHNLYTDAIMLSLEEDKVKKGDTIVFLYKYYLDSTVTISPKGVVISYLEENQMD
jgi:hypothetical protein